MYVGHVGLALALRSPRRAPPLWLLVLAAQGPDWWDAALDLGGSHWWHRSWTPHDWVPLAIGALVVAAAAASLPRGASRVGAAAIAAAAYLSHWLADFFTGWKPTWSGGPMVGLRIYDHPAADFVLETVVVVAGWWLWRRALPLDTVTGRRRDGLAAALLVLLLAIQLMADVVMAHPWRA